MLTKEQKHEQSQLLRENLEGVNTLFLLENHGLKVNDVNRLRSEVRKTEATYKVVKNTVVRLAIEGTE
ncbi:MAG: 50S ribosomal protein L10, partial [Acidobacteriota bacterium]